jgi:hypothetical protein
VYVRGVAVARNLAQLRAPLLKQFVITMPTACNHLIHRVRYKYQTVPNYLSTLKIHRIQVHLCGCRYCKVSNSNRQTRRLFTVSPKYYTSLTITYNLTQAVLLTTNTTWSACYDRQDTAGVGQYTCVTGWPLPHEVSHCANSDETVNPTHEYSGPGVSTSYSPRAALSTGYRLASQRPYVPNNASNLLLQTGDAASGWSCRLSHRCKRSSLSRATAHSYRHWWR